MPASVLPYSGIREDITRTKVEYWHDHHSSWSQDLQGIQIQYVQPETNQVT